MTTTGLDVTATLNYAGDIAGRGRLDVPHPELNNATFVPVEVPVHDARPERDQLTLETAGFCFASHDCAAALDPELFAQNMTRQPVSAGPAARYEADVADFLKALTGAEAVVPQVFGGLVARTSTRAKVQSWAPPANFVHLDFTPSSADAFFHWCMPADVIAKYSDTPYKVFQTWRAISPGPQDNTLAICDGSSVSPDAAVVIDMVVAGENQPGGKFEIRLCRHDPSHRWYYLPDMAPSDLLVFKAFDSETPYAMNAMHTGFENAAAGPHAVPRRSLETRFYAFYG